MRYTLLEAVQLILSAMDSDDVSNYNDTVESNQVALILKSTFYDIASELELPQEETLLELTDSGDNTKPTLMTVPSTVVDLSWIKYDKKTTDTYKKYEEVKYIPFPEFLAQQNLLNGTDTNVGEMSFTQNSQTFEVLYRNDKHPDYYTTTNDNQILFDSYNSTYDTRLTGTKTMAFGTVYPTFTLSNSFAPPLNPSQFSYWLNKAKVRAFAELKQVSNAEAAAEARAQKIKTQSRKQVIAREPAIMRAPRYGRK